MKPRVVVIGAGFAGLDVVNKLARHDVDITLVDRHNYHTFTPLLYQVATCALDPSAIAYPIRTIFRKQDNVRFLMGEVTAIDHARKCIDVQTSTGTRTEAYDYLVVAVGSVTNYFGQERIARHAFGLKSLDEAVALRQHILRLFEQASWTQSEDERTALLTFVVVGGGATGLESAGALYELYNHVLVQEYQQDPPLRARVILLEATDRLLAPYAEPLREAALRQLRDLGVEVMLESVVEEVMPDRVLLKGGREIGTHTLLWSAGVQSPPLVGQLDVPLARSGRVPVLPTLQVDGREGVYVIGDSAHLENPKNGQPYPMLIPVAKQQGYLAAQNILRAMRGEAQKPFVYHDKGMMATIGRSRAVAWLFYKVQLTGYLAWLSWLFLHLIELLGFRNRISVFFSWVWNYLTYDRSVRIIWGRGQGKKLPVTEDRQPVL